jgi:hypothetical protein
MSGEKREVVKVDPILRDDPDSIPKKKPEDDWPEKKKIAKDGKPDDDLSEEDKQKKAELEDLAKRIIAAAAANNLSELQRLVELVGQEIRTATSSMTRFLLRTLCLRVAICLTFYFFLLSMQRSTTTVVRVFVLFCAVAVCRNRSSSCDPQYEVLRVAYDALADSVAKKRFADVLAVLAMTLTPDTCQTLKLKLAGDVENVAPWGHEFVRRLSTEIALEYARRREAKTSVDDLYALVNRLVAFYVSHNAEPEACDLLLEVERIEAITEFLDAANFDRVCLYLANFANFVPGPEDTKILHIVLNLYRKFNQPTEALRYAMRLHDVKLGKFNFFFFRSDFARNDHETRITLCREKTRPRRRSIRTSRYNSSCLATQSKKYFIAYQSPNRRCARRWRTCSASSECSY